MNAIRYVDQILNEGQHYFNIGSKVLTVHGWRTGKITKMSKAGITVRWSNGEVTEDLSPNLLVPLTNAKTFREASKAKTTSTAKGDYLEYLADTLIPDLKDAGSEETAKDFEVLATIIKTGQMPDGADDTWANIEEFREYLEKTLIPDLEESGRTATAEDFKEGIRYMPLPERGKTDESSKNTNKE